MAARYHLVPRTHGPCLLVSPVGARGEREVTLHALPHRLLPIRRIT